MLRIIQKTQPLLWNSICFNRLLSTDACKTHVFEDSNIIDMEELMIQPRLEGNIFKLHRSKLELFCSKHLGENGTNPTIYNWKRYRQISDKGIIQGRRLACPDDLCGLLKEEQFRRINFRQYTKKLIERAPCPVLAIPADEDRINIRYP